jgi:hypothetical protein
MQLHACFKFVCFLVILKHWYYSKSQKVITQQQVNAQIYLIGTTRMSPRNNYNHLIRQNQRQALDSSHMRYQLYGRSAGPPLEPCCSALLQHAADLAPLQCRLRSRLQQVIPFYPSMQQPAGERVGAPLVGRGMWQHMHAGDAASGARQ